MPTITDILAQLNHTGFRLNAEQQAAVTSIKGPLQVIAGPGSGKTRVITARTAMLLLGGVKPDSILVLTFTKAAAQELRERVAALPGLSPEQTTGLTACTFHSLCFRLLSQFQGKPQVASEQARRRWVERALLENEEEITEDLVTELLGSISAAKNRSQSPADLPRSANLLTKVWSAYEQAKSAAGQMDYEDLLQATCRLLAAEPQLLRHLQHRWRFIMVDEFQDTNPLQYQLVQWLAAPKNNLCVVGDVDQAIYAWRAASPELLLKFPEDYPAAKTIQLKKNYRSVPTIIAAANRLIAHNRQRYPLTVEPVRRGQNVPRLLQPHDERAEAKSVVSLLQKLRAGGTALHEMAVFYRTNHQARPLVSWLVEQKIPFTIGDDGLLGLDHWVVQECLAFLHLLVDPDHSESFLRVARRQLFLSEPAAQELSRLSSLSPWQAIRQLSAAAVGPADIKQLQNHLETARRLPPSAALSYYRKQMGLDAALERYAARRGYEANAYTSYCDELALDLRGFSTTADYLQHLDRVLTAITHPPADQDALNLMTLHRSKGLEFKVVWIIGVIDGLLPHSQSQTPEQIEEERRVLYVGCTRAKDRLYLLAPAHYGQQEVEPSPFLQEMLDTEPPVEPAHES